MSSLTEAAFTNKLHLLYLGPGRQPFGQPLKPLATAGTELPPAPLPSVTSWVDATGEMPKLRLADEWQGQRPTALQGYRAQLARLWAMITLVIWSCSPHRASLGLQDQTSPS